MVIIRSASENRHFWICSWMAKAVARKLEIRNALIEYLLGSRMDSEIHCVCRWPWVHPRSARSGNGRGGLSEVRQCWLKAPSPGTIEWQKLVRECGTIYLCWVECIGLLFSRGIKTSQLTDWFIIKYLAIGTRDLNACFIRGSVY